MVLTHWLNTIALPPAFSNLFQVRLKPFEL